MGARAIERAHDAVCDVLATRLEAAITAVETDRGLSAGAIVDPVLVRAYTPQDRAEPIVLVYPVAAEPDRPAGQRNKVWDVDVVVQYSAYYGVDVEAGLLDALRVHSALLDVIDAATAAGDPTDAGFVLAPWRSDDLAIDQQRTRLTWSQEIRVKVAA